jgi:hypothetical protein
MLYYKPHETRSRNEKKGGKIADYKFKAFQCSELQKMRASLLLTILYMQTTKRSGVMKFVDVMA